MDTFYLQELIKETEDRGGGLLLNYDDKPAVVVLSVDKYNQLLNNQNTNLSLNENTMAKQNKVSPEEESKPKKILVTGGAGYIGSHVARVLLKQGYEVVILDNLSTGKRENVPDKAVFIEGDLADMNLMRDVFASSPIDAVIHMAASIEVEESVKIPEKYLNNNTINTEKLLTVMAEAGVKKIIFSSTAAVYGEQDKIPISETAPLRPNNPYGFSKLLAEKMIKYYCNYSGFQAVVFRYFNACGCDFDGAIKPTHTSHLIPIVLKAAKAQKAVTVYGNDYKTCDGTCVRDYVHVLDIAEAHVKALEYLKQGENFNVFNIGTGRGSTVKEIVTTAAETINRIIPMEIGPRRPGDAPATVADNAKIKSVLGFDLQYSDLETIIKTTWKQLE